MVQTSRGILNTLVKCSSIIVAFITNNSSEVTLTKKII